MTFWKWLFGWGLLGLLIPAVLILRYVLLHSSFGGLEFILWPTSILLMGLEGPTPRSVPDIIEVYAILMGENMLIYSVIGLLTWPLLYFALRRRNPVV